MPEKIRIWGDKATYRKGEEKDHRDGKLSGQGILRGSSLHILQIPHSAQGHQCFKCTVPDQAGLVVLASLSLIKMGMATVPIC